MSVFINIVFQNISFFARGCLLSVFGLFLASCSTMQQGWVEQNCNYRGGFLRGERDVREGKKFDLSIFDVCGGQQLTAAEQGYRKGFEKAVLEDQARTTTAAYLRQSKAQSGTSTSILDETKNYQCIVDTFRKKYSAYGTTRAEARAKAVDACSGQIKHIHCTKVHCRGTQ